MFPELLFCLLRVTLVLPSSSRGPGAGSGDLLPGLGHDLVDDVLLLLLLEQLFVLFQELLMLLLDHQLLQGLGLAALLLGQGGRLGSAQGTVTPYQLGDRGRRQWKAT